MGIAPADLHEPSTEIETVRTPVLLVDIHFRRAVPNEGLAEQRRADACAAGRIRHEEHLEAPFGDSGKTNGLAIVLG